MALAAGCVDIPSEGHTPPDFKAQIRVMYLDPSLSGTAMISIASAPDFDSFQTNVLGAGSFGTVTSYSTVDAGGKQLLVTGDADTSALSFASDQVGTLLVLPMPDRFVLLGEGRMFDPVGITGASRVRFVNAVTRGASDTLDVAVDVVQDSVVVDPGLAFRGTSDEYLEVPEGTTVTFYLTRSGAAEAITDVVMITGVSNTDYTIVGSGSADAAVLASFENR